MTDPTGLPEHVTYIDKESSFSFACHKGVKCFTECCRMLELALTPYDVLRLRKATGKTSSELLNEVIIIEQDPGEAFPRFYLTMIDDGRSSCTYVSGDGCQVYSHRPGACRAYPLGRGSVRIANQTVEERFILIKESHCQGFSETKKQSATEYVNEQGLAIYNEFNDKVAEILQHETVRQGFIPSRKQIELFILALYDIDSFRAQLLSGENDLLPTLKESERTTLQDDEQLLVFAISWLKQELFSIF